MTVDNQGIEEFIKQTLDHEETPNEEIEEERESKAPGEGRPSIQEELELTAVGTGNSNKTKDDESAPSEENKKGKAT